MDGNMIRNHIGLLTLAQHEDGAPHAVAIYDHRSDGTVEMSDLAFGVPEAGTVRAVNVFGLGREMPSGVQRDEQGVLHRPYGFEQTRFGKGLVQIIKQAEKVGSFDRVEYLAKVVIARNALDLKEGMGVVAAAGFFHVLVETEEGGTLGKKNRKGRERDIGQSVETVLAGARIRQPGRYGTPALDKLIQAARVYAPKACRSGPKSTSYNGVADCNKQVNSSYIPSLSSLRPPAPNPHAGVKPK